MCERFVARGREDAHMRAALYFAALAVTSAIVMTLVPAPWIAILLLLPASVDVLLMVVLGGPGTLVGGLIGATVVVFLREYLATVVQWWQYVLGAVYVATILYLPGGIMGLFKGGAKR